MLPKARNAWEKVLTCLPIPRLATPRTWERHAVVGQGLPCSRIQLLF